MKERMVFEVVVKSRHMYADMLQLFRRAMGMNLKGYESMISEAIQEASDKLYEKYPDVYNVRIGTSQVTINASEIIVYGTIKVE